MAEHSWRYLGPRATLRNTSTRSNSKRKLRKARPIDCSTSQAVLVIAVMLKRTAVGYVAAAYARGKSDLE